jgi:hypothetical protein
MNSKEQPLRPVEIEHIFDQFNNFIQGGEATHIGGMWFAQDYIIQGGEVILYHVHKTITENGNSSFQINTCQNRNGVWGCGGCEDTAPEFIQLWAKLNPVWTV